MDHGMWQESGEDERLPFDENSWFTNNGDTSQISYYADGNAATYGGIQPLPQGHGENPTASYAPHTYDSPYNQSALHNPQNFGLQQNSSYGGVRQLFGGNPQDSIQQHGGSFDGFLTSGHSNLGSFDLHQQQSTPDPQLRSMWDPSPSVGVLPGAPGAHFTSPYSFGDGPAAIDPSLIDETLQVSHAQAIPFSGPPAQAANQTIPQHQDLGQPLSQLTQIHPSFGGFSNSQVTPQQPSASTALGGPPTDNNPRITHRELYDLAENNHTLRFKGAPYVVILSEQPVSVNPKIVNKIPQYQPRGNRTHKPLVSAMNNPSSVPVAKKAKTDSTPKLALKNTKGVPADGLKADGVTKQVQKDAASPGAARDSRSPSSERSDSDDESDEGDDRESQLKKIRTETRPADKVGAAEWDAIGILFFPKHQNLSREQITTAIPKFCDLMSSLRDDLRTLNDELKKLNSESSDAKTTKEDAEKRSSQTAKLTEKQASARKALTKALEAAFLHGHPNILSNLFTNTKLILVFSGLLIEAVNRKDFVGELPRATFRLLTMITGLDNDLLQKIKFGNIRSRFEKATDAEIKSLLTQIANNANAADEKKKKDPKKALDAKREAALLGAQEKIEAQKAVEAPKGTQPPKGTQAASGLKRARESDGSNAVPNKKVASESTVVTTQKPTTIIPTTKVVPGQRGTTPVFANLKRAAAKPQPPSSAAKPTAPAATVKKDQPPASKSSFSALLESIQKPKSPPKQPEQPVGPPETPEEKAKRERKESRRHLRVSWKQGTDLEQIRLFTHEESEDEGRDGDLLRDAYDDRSEGMMHKQRVLSDFMDDDEDEYDPEFEYKPYPELVSIDFTVIGQERLQKNFVTRGGEVTFTTPQQEVQARRESHELMVIYTDPRDIPPSPKEAPPEDSGQSQSEKAFGQPKDGHILQRIQEIQQYGVENAHSLMLRRQQEEKSQGSRDERVAIPANVTAILSQLASLHPSGRQSGAPTTSDVGSALSALRQVPSEKTELTSNSSQQASGLPVNMSSKKPDTNAAKADELVASIKAIAGPLFGKPFPATEPPFWYTDERRKAEWWEGYNRDKAAAERKKLEQNQQYAPAPVMPQPPVVAPAQQYPQVPQYAQHASNPQSLDQTQLQSLLAGLDPAQASTLQAYQQAYPTAFQNADFLRNYVTALAQSNAGQPYTQQAQYPTQQAQYQAQSQQPQYQNPNQQSRWDNDKGSNDTGRHGHSKSGRDHQKKFGWDNSHNNEERYRDPRGDPSEYKRGTKPCKFWQEGKCAKGENCTFRHD